MGKRRGWGEGSVYQRADGYWVGQVDAGRCPGHRKRNGEMCRRGHRIRPRVVRRKKKDVLAQLAELHKRGTGDNQTIREYSAWWLATVKEGVVAQSTLTKYRERFDNWINPFIGATTLRKLTDPGAVELLQQWQRDLDAHGIGPTSRAAARTTLSMMLRYAVGARTITWNPAEYVEAPKPQHRVDDAFTAEEAEAVLEAAKGDRLEGLYTLAVRYGMRQGELLSVPDDRLDLDTELLRVSKSKTEAGRDRGLPLLAGTLEVLRAHRKNRAAEQLAAGPMWQEHGLLFVEKDGSPIEPVKLRRLWNKLLKKAGVAHKCRNCGSDQRCSGSIRRFHASRHSAATLLLEAGVPLEVVSAILGHSQISITADLYARVRADLMRRGILKLDVLPEALDG